MKRGDDPTDPSPAADTDPGPDRQAGGGDDDEPKIDDPAVAELLDGLTFKSGWVPRRHKLATTDGELAAKWSADARDAPTAGRTPTPVPNVVLACTDEPTLLRGSGGPEEPPPVSRLVDTAPALRFNMPAEEQQGPDGERSEKTLDEGLERSADLGSATGRRKLYGYGGLLVAAVLACAIGLLARKPVVPAAETVVSATPSSPAPEPRPTAALPPVSALPPPAAPPAASSVPATPEAPAAQPIPEKPVYSAPLRKPATPPVRAHNPEPPTSPAAPAPAPGRDPSSSPF
jgi:hypothetical protein